MKYAEGTMQAEIFKRFRAIVLDEMKDLEPSGEATRAFRTATDCWYMLLYLLLNRY